MASQERVFPQSAAVPFRWRGGRLEVLVVTSMSGNWIVPKGLDEPHLTPRQSAAMEAYEEAGVRGVVWEGVTGVYDKPKWGGKCRVKVYVMLVEEILDKYPERAYRKRRWVSPEEAARMMSNPHLGALILRASHRVRRAFA